MMFVSFTNITTVATSAAGLLTFPQCQDSPPVFSGIRVDQSIVFYVVFRRSLLVHLSISILAIELSVLRITDSDNPLVSVNLPSQLGMLSNVHIFFFKNIEHPINVVSNGFYMLLFIVVSFSSQLKAYLPAHLV